MLYHRDVKKWNSPTGLLNLERYPFKGEKSHQAWDAADEWIAARFAEAPAVKDPSIAVCGEAFGVLATAWGAGNITVISDSYMSLLALKKNRELNPGSATGRLLIRTADTERSSSDTETVDRLVIRLPKSLDLLEHYLLLAMDYCDGHTEIWLGGMDKRWSRGVSKIAAKYLNTEEVFPFERHARWIRCSRLSAAANRRVDKAASELRIWKTEKYPLSVIAEPAVFSGCSLDAGTAAFLEAFPETETRAASVIADIGCGSGILGMTAALLSPEAEIIFSDESYLAIKAARANAGLNSIDGRARFITGNGLSGGPQHVDDHSVDLVLCNPPFHYKNIQTREPAEFMFSEAKRVLKPGGTVQIVGNSHLGYHKLLKDFFPDTREVLRDNRFTVLRSRA